jgi:hypothetical protein
MTGIDAEACEKSGFLIKPAHPPTEPRGLTQDLAPNSLIAFLVAPRLVQLAFECLSFGLIDGSQHIEYRRINLVQFFCPKNKSRSNKFSLSGLFESIAPEYTGRSGGV